MKLLCETMQVTRSGYYKFLTQPKSESAKREETLLIEVKALHQISCGSYGKRRMAKGLQAKGYKVGVEYARSLMRKAGVECNKQRRRFRVTTQSNPALPVAEKRIKLSV